MLHRLSDVVNQLFFGDAETERLYFENSDGTAYIKSIDSNDVRTEGMSYAMNIAVQLNNKTMFDALWKWARTNMRHNEPSDPRFGYFAWHCSLVENPH